MCQLNTYTGIGYILPTFGGYMTDDGGGWRVSVVAGKQKNIKKFPWYQIVRGAKLSGAKLS